MSAALKKDYTLEEFESRYTDITNLYGYAEELLNTVESKLIANPETQLEIVEPLIHELSEATDVLAEEFILIAENRKFKNPQNKSSKSRIESALRKIYSGLHEYQKRVTLLGRKVTKDAQNIADPIVGKIQQQVEKIVVVFLEFIHVSLHNVMNKTDLDTLKQRDARIAIMMHQIALGQQG